MNTRTVLITGAARRLGARIATTLAHTGWRVVIHTRTPNDPDATHLADVLDGDLLVADLADHTAVLRMFRTLAERHPTITAIVNNAACFSRDPSPSAATCAMLHAVNATAPHTLTTALAMRLLDAAPDMPRHGAIVNILDCRIRDDADHTPYTETKRALAAATRDDARLFAGSLRVNAVAPGPVLAPVAAANREPAGALLLDARPTPDAVANAVCFLLDAESITGQTLFVDAGQHLLYPGHS